MKLKHLSTEFEYFTQKWLIFGLIQLGSIAYIFIFIWTTTVQNLIPIYQQICILQIFSHFSRFFQQNFDYFTPKIAIFLPIQLGIIANIVS